MRFQYFLCCSVSVIGFFDQQNCSNILGSHSYREKPVIIMENQESKYIKFEIHVLNTCFLTLLCFPNFIFTINFWDFYIHWDTTKVMPRYVGILKPEFSYKDFTRLISHWLLQSHLIIIISYNNCSWKVLS